MRNLQAIAAATLLAYTTMAPAATIDVGSHLLRENTSGQPIEIFVSPGEPPEFVTGMNLIAQIADGGPEFEPSIWLTDREYLSTPIDLETGTVWTESILVLSTYPEVVDDRAALAAVVRSPPAPVDGLLVTLFVDTTGLFIGDSQGPWDLRLVDSVVGDTELLGMDGGPITVECEPGEIALVKEPSTFSTVVVMAGLVLGWYVMTYRKKRR